MKNFEGKEWSMRSQRRLLGEIDLFVQNFIAWKRAKNSAENMHKIGGNLKLKEEIYE